MLRNITINQLLFLKCNVHYLQLHRRILLQLDHPTNGIV